MLTLQKGTIVNAQNKKYNKVNDMFNHQKIRSFLGNLTEISILYRK